MGMARQSDPSPADPSPADPTLPVLLTRPRAQAEAFAARLLSRLGDRIRPLVAPLMAPEFLSPALPDGPFAAVVFTSAHGVEGAVRLGVPLPKLAWCVGRSTAAAAAAAGFRPRSADGDAEALVKAILADPPKGRILYIHGVDTSGDVDKILNSEGIMTISLQVYLQKALPLSDESARVLQQGGPVILPLFSPRSARLFHAAMPSQLRSDLRIAAISPAVAAASRDIPHAALTIAARPDAEAMLDAVESLLAAPPLP
ncbi:uroporphyrinogen-III synthase [Rhodobacter calidifons]|uniref:Uroporphyrinogen-III synthase n=1 Tax=Rhodobacter calidifons TaxID=2715277 RepID=A0ABX0G3C9_9RHOB|nr:uroporphyrinogen-III synthase [Rhodobacter calidifons]NHB75716.1 uroporphyrinogen-III synthase [Rhodobacter calidifons]